MFVARTAVFLERELLSKKNSGRIIDLDEDRELQDIVEPELEHEQNETQDVENNTAQEHRLFVDLVGFSMSQRDIMDFS